MAAQESSVVAGSESLAELIYRNVDPDDLAARDPAAQAGVVANLLAVAEQRDPQSAIVRVSNPATATAGWSVGHTVINVVVDDMVFLVDSVAAELQRQGLAVHLVLHPVVHVTRDAAGRLRAVAAPPVDSEAAPVEPAPPAVAAMPADARPGLESWMHIEVDWQADPEAPQRITEALLCVLGDVRKAVADWRPMVGAAQAVADALVANPPCGVPADQVDQSVELLRWMADNRFTFLGYRPYFVQRRNGDIALASEPGSGLGLMRSPRREATSFANLPGEVRARALEPVLLILTKANRRSTVHRNVYLDYVGIKMFDPAGRVVGEHRFIGLFAASAYTDSVSRVPVIDRKVRELRARLGISKKSHSGRDLQQFLETFPRDELFAADISELLEIARVALTLRERRATRVFLRTDPYKRFLSALVYLPRDRYTTAARLGVMELLRTAIGGATVDYTAWVTESVLAQLHVIVRMPAGVPVPAVAAAELQAAVAAVTRSWEDNLTDTLLAQFGEVRTHELLSAYPSGFPAAYKEATGPSEALADLRQLTVLGEQLAVSLQPEPAGPEGPPSGQANVRLRLYSRSDISLAQVLPVLTSLGVQVVSERPYRLLQGSPGTSVWVYDFGLRWAGEGQLAPVAGLWQEAFLACWEGQAEPDSLNALVTSGLNWRQVNVLRAFVRYLRQAGSSFSQAYLEGALLANPGIAALIWELFATRLDPERTADATDTGDWRAAAAASLRGEIGAALERVASLDQDRILRSISGLAAATLRTNYFQPDRPALACKLDPAEIADLPLPRPKFEIWVYSPRVEGVHLRYGLVARGGLRWSDRREDFRTEVLGLVKAQAVKNAVIVPVGAKGGFFAKQLPSPSEREAWLAEGIAAYRIFVGSLLDITDNLADGHVVPPPRVVRHDGDDPYLVVAADKGTAAFSDLANGVAKDRGYWLGDAFASGGSAGYDHKAMGITARGAWESVRAHFREISRDPEVDEFTAVGIGDMSGDVFGNGMLRSDRIRLVAAFDHRHVFLDPTPDPAQSFRERQRLFALPRSSWADYDPSVISPGGGVYPRSAKAVPISDQVRQALGMGAGPTTLTPIELLRAILTAPVDLLWNGGIGTYVKASGERNADVGDRANDALRVDGRDLRARVVGEGGNLGFTQPGRIEAARTGVLINTDAIDNSAGVDTSDHEVNIKIALDQAIAGGSLAPAERVPLLAAMGDEVASAVLRDNVEQNTLLSFNAHQGAVMLPALRRVMAQLELTADLDRGLESLPDDRALAAMQNSGGSLTTPELAVISAYVKLSMKEDLLATGLPDEEWCAERLRGYFPAELRRRFAAVLGRHPLRREIVVTGLVNEIVNRGGITFAMRAAEETGAGPAEVARAYAVSCGVFDLPGLWARIEACARQVPVAAEHAMRWDVSRLVDRATRWFLQSRGGTLDVDGEIARFQPPLALLAPQAAGMLRGAERERLAARARHLRDLGAPPLLAGQVAAVLDWFALLDVIEVSWRTGESPEATARVYFELSERYGVDELLTRISGLPRPDRWSSLARAGLRGDLYSALAALTTQVLHTTAPGDPPERRAQQWERRNAEGLGRARATLAEIAASDTFDLATLSVALRTVRTLGAQGH